MNETKTAGSIHLQGIGQHSAIPARELTVGRRTVWNYGYVEVVKSIRDVSPHYLMVEIETAKGEVSMRRIKKDRLVAVLPID